MQKHLIISLLLKSISVICRVPTGVPIHDSIKTPIISKVPIHLSLHLNGANNVAFDGWNKYGDDALAGSNVVSISGLTIDGAANKTLTSGQYRLLGN